MTSYLFSSKYFLEIQGGKKTKKEKTLSTSSSQMGSGCRLLRSNQDQEPICTHKQVSSDTSDVEASEKLSKPERHKQQPWNYKAARHYIIKSVQLIAPVKKSQALRGRGGLVKRKAI